MRVHQVIFFVLVIKSVTGEDGRYKCSYQEYFQIYSPKSCLMKHITYEEPPKCSQNIQHVIEEYLSCPSQKPMPKLQQSSQALPRRAFVYEVQPLQFSGSMKNQQFAQPVVYVQQRETPKKLQEMFEDEDVKKRPLPSRADILLLTPIHGQQLCDNNGASIFTSNVWTPLCSKRNVKEYHPTPNAFEETQGESRSKRETFHEPLFSTKFNVKLQNIEKQPSTLRNKRDLNIAKHGYDFFMNMLPEFVSIPLQNSVRSILNPNAPRIRRPPTLKEKIEEEARKRKEALRAKIFGRTSTIPGPTKLSLFDKRRYQFPQAISGYKNNYKYPYDDLYSKDNLRYHRAGPNDDLYLGDISRHRKDVRDVGSYYQQPNFAAWDKVENYKRQGRAFPDRTFNRKSSEEFNEETFLKKLKKLNGFSSRHDDLEESQDKFLNKVLDTNRKKRSIIIGSDEIDHPFHRIRRLPDESRERFEDAEGSFEEGSYEESEEEFHPQPDVIVGKSILKKAVREELNKYRQKEAVAKPPSPFQVPPHNPLFLILNAPMEFLRHFHEINKGANPLLTALPRLVLETKKYVRNFGRNFRKNCLNLYSNIVGDFDHDPTSAFGHMIRPNKFKRSIPEGTDLHTCQEQTDAKNMVKYSKWKRDISGQVTEETNPLDDFLSSGVDEDQIIIEHLELSSEPEQERVNEHNFDRPCEQYEPEYSLVFDGGEILNKIAMKNELKAKDEQNQKSTEETNQNFRKAIGENVRKKRYVVQLVNEDDVHDYVAEKVANEGYMKSLTDYYSKLNNFVRSVFTGQSGQCTPGQNCYESPRNTLKKLKPAHDYEDNRYRKRPRYYDDDSDESYERPTRSKIQIEKLKPKVIIDNHGLPFLDIDGMKRPLIPRRRRKGGILKSFHPIYDGASSEETSDKIVGLIAQAKEKEIVGATSRSNFAPLETVRGRISYLLGEIDNLVHIDFEEYDEIFDELIRIQHIKTSIVQDWKRLLIKEKCDDINAKIGILDKFRDLQHFKDEVVEEIAKVLKRHETKFVKRKLIGALVRLHKLQSIITNVVDDFEEHLQMNTHFNAKNEIEYVDTLSSLNFVNGRTRSDIIESFSGERDEALQNNIELLDKLKKFLVSSNEHPEKIDKVAKILWEIRNIEKMQKSTVQDLNEKIIANYKTKKELKILIDLQKRYESCIKDQREVLDGMESAESEENVGKFRGARKKTPQQILEDIRKKYDEYLEKVKQRKLQLLSKKG